MSECVYCGESFTYKGTIGADTCEACWYGMRLEPEKFEERMKAAGRRASRVKGGPEVTDTGSVIFRNRSPYAKPLREVARSQVDALGGFSGCVSCRDLTDAVEELTRLLTESAVRHADALAETERMRKPLEPGGARWLSEWHDRGRRSVRYAVVWEEGAKYPEFLPVNTARYDSGRWSASPHGAERFATEAEAKAAAEEWAEETHGVTG